MRRISFTVEQGFIHDANARLLPMLRKDYDVLTEQLGRRGIAIDPVTEQVRKFAVAFPSWGVGTGMARYKENGAIDPLAVYRASGYRENMGAECLADAPVFAGLI